MDSSQSAHHQSTTMSNNGDHILVGEEPKNQEPTEVNDNSSSVEVCQLENDSSNKNQRIAELESLIEELKCKRKVEMNELSSNYESRLKQLQMESNRRENILIMRLTLKDKELQDCLAQVEALKNSRLPSSTQLRSYLLDPALNYMFEKMKKEVDDARSRVEEMQNEMNAWKFSADSITGKQLMAKCRQLHQENEELGKMISSGKIAKLESGLAMHKNYSETLKKSQSEIEEVLNEIEEEAEGLQNTVYQLQQKLQEVTDKQDQLALELQQDQGENLLEHKVPNQSS